MSSSAGSAPSIAANTAFRNVSKNGCTSSHASFVPSRASSKSRFSRNFPALPSFSGSSAVSTTALATSDNDGASGNSGFKGSAMKPLSTSVVAAAVAAAVALGCLAYDDHAMRVRVAALEQQLATATRAATLTATSTA